MTDYPAIAVERAMKIQEVILRAIVHIKKFDPSQPSARQQRLAGFWAD